MFLSQQQKERLLPSEMKHQRLGSILCQLTDTKEKIKKDEKAYYDEEKDMEAVENYYSKIDFDNTNNNEVMQSLTKLLQETHTNKVKYDPSEYVYPWVDLRPDGNLNSIYSGEKRKAEEVIKEDYMISLKRQEEIEKMGNWDSNQVKSQLKQIENNFKYNCEHTVPQSWFNEQESMRGDIHHLFTCDPDCNSFRSNYPYHDFIDYSPQQININRVEEKCGKADEELFEPEYGKGTVARAMLYFLLRYPDKIEQSYRGQINIDLLLEWHQNYSPDIYEKHRNQAICEIQGNRNPYIDFPKKMNDFTMF